MGVRRNRLPFYLVAVVISLVCLAILRLPESFVVELERQRPFTSDQSGWAYRLLAIAAFAQAAYGGFSLLHVDRVAAVREQDPKVAAMPRERVLRTVTRTAAGMVFLTIVYGIAAFWVTGERGGFWLFPLMAVAQGAWYYRQLGQIGRWLAFQPEPSPDDKRRSEWRREPPDYSPPLARGLVPAPLDGE